MPPAPDPEAACRALRDAASALAAAQPRALPFEMAQSLATLARCYVVLGHAQSADACLASALHWAGAAGAVDLTVDLLCEASELAARRADEAALDHPDDPALAGAARDRACDLGCEAAALAGQVADTGWEVKVLLRIGDVLDRCGSRDEAVWLQARALRLMAGNGAATDTALLPGLGRLADA